jgi:hypothetical protein
MIRSCEFQVEGHNANNIKASMQFSRIVEATDI